MPTAAPDLDAPVSPHREDFHLGVRPPALRVVVVLQPPDGGVSGLVRTEKVVGRQAAPDPLRPAPSAEHPASVAAERAPPDQALADVHTVAALLDDSARPPEPPTTSTPARQTAAPDGLAPADWVRFARVQAALTVSSLTPVAHAPQQGEPGGFEPPRPPAGTVSPGPLQGPPAAPALPRESDLPDAAADDAPPRPERAGLLSAGPGLALSTLDSALDALAEHAHPGGPSLPCWLGLCGWGMGAALAWLAAGRRRSEEEIALTQERP
jgi:hypothetical protein